MNKRKETKEEYLKMSDYLETLKTDKEKNKFLKEYYKNLEPYDFDDDNDPYEAYLNLYFGSL